MGSDQAEELTKAHAARFHPRGATLVYRAPGRVNLIGEHTDYTGGFVLPIAIAQETRVAVAPNAHGELRAYSVQEKKELRWPVAALPILQPAGDWGDYVAGVAKELLLAGYTPSAVSLYIDSSVPVGAGLSSSAALEVGVALALLNGRPMEPKQVALLAQRAENKFVGLPCGIMDQSVCTLAEAGSALLLDCRSLETRSVRLPAGLEIVAVKSHRKHALGKSEYPLRVAQCQEATEAMRRLRPGVQQLRDATLEDLARAEMSAVARQRARHVITENARVLAFVEAAGRDDLPALGRLAVESHESLRDDFAVSCEELDALVVDALALPHVYGARMTGGGFGGCTVNFIAAGQAESFVAAIQQQYQQRYGVVPEAYVCQPSAGAGRIE